MFLNYPMPIERKLAAIMFTDIAGYTEQMSKDEAVAISLLNKKDSILKPLISKHNGTYVKSTGDGSLSHFNSAVDAATCAKRLQESIYDDKDLNVRVGVHLGETIFEKGDIHGDGVNIASRLESMAVEGGVFVSKEVHDQLVNQKEFEGVSLGLQSMKGVGRLIEVYGLKGDKLSEPNPNEYQDDKVVVHSDDEVPSIAIIPFRNKGKEEDAFYAYGICADLISDCSSAGLIRVASLEDIEKVEHWDKLKADELASKLFVRYIAQGTLWKMDDMFQLSIELYDTKESNVVWSDRWQEKWDNLPTIKGSLSDGLLKTLDTKPRIEDTMATSNPKAYEFYLKGKYKFEKRKSKEDFEIAQGLIKKAIELDNNLINAKHLLAFSYFLNKDYDKAMEKYTDNMEQAINLGDKHGVAGAFAGLGLLSWNNGEYEKALDYYNNALKVSTKIGDNYWKGISLASMGMLYQNIGQYDKSLKYIHHSLTTYQEVDNRRMICVVFNTFGFHYWLRGDYNHSLDYLTRSLTMAEENDDEIDLTINPLINIGLVYVEQHDYKKSLEYLNKTEILQKQLYGRVCFEAAIYISLSKKNLGMDYDINLIKKLIKEKKYIEDFQNHVLYQLLEEVSYLETAYNQIQETANNLEPDIAAKFLSYPTPKAIVEEWEKVK
jgi:class 3 adenylate cyclase/tetratricopeptide (TPR) repeat protein